MVSAVIVAAGAGKRFGPGIDKLFYEVSGRPVVAHTWMRFDAVPAIDEIVVVVHPDREADFREMAAELTLTKPWLLARGGAERQDSVWNGIGATSHAAEVLAIQDGARPCTTVATIEATLAAARESGAAVAAQRVTDTLKESADGRNIDRTVDRSRLWSVQTPQAFRREVIVAALTEVRRRGLNLTDDTAACEVVGQEVRLVESKDPNPKVTYPRDVPWVESVLAAMRESAGSACR